MQNKDINIKMNDNGIKLDLETEKLTNLADTEIRCNECESIIKMDSDCYFNEFWIHKEKQYNVRYIKCPECFAKYPIMIKGDKEIELRTQYQNLNEQIISIANKVAENKESGNLDKNIPLMKSYDRLLKRQRGIKNVLFNTGKKLKDAYYKEMKTAKAE